MSASPPTPAPASANAPAPRRRAAPAGARLRNHLAHARTAAAHAADPATWRNAFRMHPPTPAVAPALRVGAAVAFVLAAGGALGHPELAAVAGLGAITAAFARGEPHRRRTGKTAIAGATIVGAVALGGACAGLPVPVQIAVLSLAGGAGAWLLSALRIFGPGAVVIVFAGAAAAMMGGPASTVAAAALGAAVGWLCAAAPVTRAPDRGSRAERHWVRTGAARLVTAEFAVAGVRIALAAALSGWAAWAMGLEHPLWASMGATAALQSLSYAAAMQRSIQRLVGNVAGAAVALAFIALGMGFWPTAAVIVALQFLTEVTIARNYALATTAITPMALLMMGLSGALTPSMALSRVADTAVGVLIGVVLAALTIHPADRGHLAAA